MAPVMLRVASKMKIGRLRGDIRGEVIRETTCPEAFPTRANGKAPALEDGTLEA